jgi:hypothetical protein
VVAAAMNFRRRKPRGTARSQEPLKMKYRRRGMAKTNERKLGKRQRNQLGAAGATDIEMYGATFNPHLSPQWCNAVKG